MGQAHLSLGKSRVCMQTIRVRIRMNVLGRIISQKKSILMSYAEHSASSYTASAARMSLLF